METIFTVHDYEIQMKSTEVINLWFWGDLHSDTAAFDRDRWRWFLKKSKADPNPYYLGMGDYFDFASAKEQRKLLSAELHETTMQKFDKMTIKHSSDFAKEILPVMGGRLIGIIGGNHSWRLHDGKMVEEDLAKRLKTKYLGYISLIKLTIRLTDRGSAGDQSILIMACHGRPGGKLYGASINKIADMKLIFPMCDIYAMGDDHQRGVWPVTVLSWSRERPTRVRQHRQYFVRSGSFLKAYEPDVSSYVVGKLLKPADLGAVKINISFHRDRSGGRDVLVKDMEGVS
jgi:hypothetical protein